MHDEMYEQARIAKLKELKRLMMELELSGEDGTLSPEAIKDALDEAGEMGEEDSSAAKRGEYVAPSPESVKDALDEAGEMGEEEEEEDSLAAKRRAFFKPKKPEMKKPGTAVLISIGGPAKSQMPKTADGRSSTKGKMGGSY